MGRSCNRHEEITLKFDIYSTDWWCLMNTMVDFRFWSPPEEACAKIPAACRCDAIENLEFLGD